MTNIRTLFSGILIFIILLHCGQNKKKFDYTQKEQIPNDHVCMFYDVNLGKKSDYPVDIDGKLYFGCCDSSRNELSKDNTKHFATDPLTGEKVDKALAVIFPDPLHLDDGNVLYFLSKENYVAYLAKNK